MKPRWIARNSREREAMYRWVVQSLDEEDDAVYTLTGTIDEAASNEPEIEAAWKGNIEPLRRKYPHHAPFLVLPSVRARKAWLKEYDRELTLVNLIKSDVERIKDLWKKHYDGRVNRPLGQLKAIEIAARRLLDIAARRLSDDRLLEQARSEMDRAINRIEHPSGPSGEKKSKKVSPRGKPKKARKRARSH